MGHLLRIGAASQRLLCDAAATQEQRSEDEPVMICFARLVHHTDVIAIEGESYRAREGDAHVEAPLELYDHR